MNIIDILMEPVCPHCNRKLAVHQFRTGARPVLVNCRYCDEYFAVQVSATPRVEVFSLTPCTPDP